MENKQHMRDIYLANLKTKKRKTGEEFLVGSICLEQLDELPGELIQKGTNGKHYVRIMVHKNFAGLDKFGNSHSMKVDTFKLAHNPAATDK